MKKRSLFSFDIFISEEDKDFLESIESDVQDGKYSGWEWDAFVSIGLQMFSKMVKNGVDTETFEYLIDNVDKVRDLRKKEDIKQSSATDIELNQIVGHDRIKNKIRRLSCLMTKTFWLENSMNYVFVGKPGTGKTVLARALAKEFFDKKIIKENKLIEVDRSSLVGEYTGQTAPKVRRCFEEAEGGVLFIDEAYSLCSDDGYGAEAISEIVKLMEDYRGKMVVILAGYKEETLKMLRMNPGLNSRINGIFEFEDYTKQELKEILDLFCEKAIVTLDKEVDEKLIKLATRNKNKKDYGNARELRNILEGVLEFWSIRDTERSNWNIITMEDVLNWQLENKIVLDSDLCDA